MLLRFALRGVQIALGAACAFLVYAGLAPIFTATAVSAVNVRPAEEFVPEPHGAADYEIIGRRNLFAAVQGAAPPPLPAPPQPQKEELEESKLRYRLHGTMAPGPPAVAALEDLNTGERHFVRPGDELPNGVKIMRIERKRVVISNKDKLEAISMDDEQPTAQPKKAARRGRASSRRRNARTSRARRAANRAARQIEQVAQQKPRTLLQIFDQGSWSQVQREGDGIAFQVTDIKPQSALEEAGVPESAVCYAVNGSAVTGLGSFTPGPNGQLCITCDDRGGVARTYCF